AGVPGPPREARVVRPAARDGAVVPGAVTASAWCTDRLASRREGLRRARRDLPPEPRREPLPQAERDVLDLEVLLDAPVTALAADAGLLHAAERRLRGGGHAVVDAHDAVLERLGHAERARHVVREQVGRQAVR